MNEPSILKTTDSNFSTAKDISGLRAWLMRAYFNPKKHSQEIYYSSTVTKDNVLEYISNCGKKFPQTPRDIVNVWELLPSLRKGLSLVPSDEPTAKAESLYKTSETTLYDMAIKFNISTTMVNKISSQAEEKFKRLLGQLANKNEHIASETNDKISMAFLTAVENFVDVILVSNTPEQVFQALVKKKVVYNADIKKVDEIEKEALQELISWKNEQQLYRHELEDVLLNDLKKNANVFRLLQTAVSYIMFPKSGKEAAE